MASARPAALHLAVALAGVLLGTLGPALPSLGIGEAEAQQVTSARVVPPAVPPAAPPAALLPATKAPAGTAATPAAPVSASTTLANTAAAPDAAATAPTNAAAPARTARAGTGLAGRVLGNASPLPAAGVYAYQLADLALYKVMTDPQGNFLFRDLPAGLYKIIAHKPGFLPVVILVTRTTAQAYQFLELQLAQRDGRAGATAKAAKKTAPSSTADEDFWALRARIPADVLRDIEAAELPQAQDGQAKAARAVPPGAGPASGGGEPRGAGVSSAALASGAGGGRFHTEVQAMAGVADVAQVGVGQVSSGKVGIEGQLGKVQVGLSGRFWQMSSDSLLASAGGVSRALPGVAADGKTSAMSLDVEAGPSSRITVTSLNNHLLPRTAVGPGGPVGLDHYGVSWSQALGDNSRSDFAAQYTSENNYHRQSAIDPAEIPGASRTWNVEGSYTTGVGDNGTLQAGFRYSESTLGLALPSGSPAGLPPAVGGVGPVAALSGLNAAGLAPDHRTVDFFSRGGTRLQPALLVEYGLFTTLLDGSVSLTPQGGLVLQLDDGWQARGSVSHRAYQQSAVNPNFLPALFKEADLCEQGGKACYELNLSHRSGEDETVSVSGSERIVGQTLRLYFSDVVFDRLESLYLVPGDRLPELRFMVSHRFTPQIKASFESSFATGGGGIFVGADGRPYRNQVRYVVTSLDTHFLNSATGVFLAFHHLTQGQAALGTQAALTSPLAPVDLDRLQLMLSQDLSFLWNLAAQWALQVNMELSRGSAPYLASTDSQLHRRILGGIAIKF